MTEPSLVEFKDILNNFIDEQESSIGLKASHKGKISLKDILNNEENCKYDYPSSPGKPNLNHIKSTGETAFQRAIFNGIETELTNGTELINKVRWLDLELPVTLNKNSRRRCLDLVGSLDHSDSPVLCELKFCTNCDSYASNHPVYAIVELLVYYYLLLSNYENLDDRKVYHKLDGMRNFTWSTFLKRAPVLLIVAANESYWKYWYKRIESKDQLVKGTYELEKNLNTKIHLFVTQDENFSKLTNGEGYRPTVSSFTWSIIK